MLGYVSIKILFVCKHAKRKTQIVSHICHVLGVACCSSSGAWLAKTKKNSKISNNRSNQLQQQSAVAVPRITAVSIYGGSSSSSSCSTIHGRKGAAGSEKRELRPTGSVSCNVPRFPGFHHDTSVVGVPCW